MDECTDDLNRACESMESMKGDPRYFLSELADDHNFVETKKGYAKEMVTGFIKLNGATIGVVANRTELFDNGESVEKFDEVPTAEGCEKAAEMINFKNCLI